MSENPAENPETPETTREAEALVDDPVASLTLERDELQDKLLRLGADFQNYKRRVEREKQQAIQFANENVLSELLQIVDSLDRAVAAAPSSDVTSGVELTRAQLLALLERFGVTTFTTVGEPFDPARAEAVAVREDPDVPSQVVLEEHRRGFFLHERLLRPALVVVAE